MLTGTLPSELAQLPLLEALILNGNFISGQIPREFALMQGLIELILHGNGLTGAIPAELGASSNRLHSSIFSTRKGLINTFKILDVSKLFM